MRLQADVENAGPGVEDDGGEDALLHSIIGCHLLFAAEADAFVSLLEPPDGGRGGRGALRASTAAGRCSSAPAPRRDLVLASPVILYDHPTVAPQSAGDFFDGTEIDEMLTLRVQTMTDEEKAEARATDPRAAAIIDRCETMPDDVMASLHGTCRRRGRRSRRLDPMPEWSDPGADGVLIGGGLVERGQQGHAAPADGAPTPTTSSSCDRVATVAESSTTSTATCTSPSPSTTTRPPTCGTWQRPLPVLRARRGRGVRNAVADG